MKKIFEIIIGGLLLFMASSFLFLLYNAMYSSGEFWVREYGFPYVFYFHTVKGEFISSISGSGPETMFSLENFGIDLGIYVVAFLILKLGWDRLWKK